MDSSYPTQVEYCTPRNEDTKCNVKEESWWQLIKKETEKEQFKAGAMASVLSTKQRQDSSKVIMDSSQIMPLVSMKRERDTEEISAAGVVNDGVSTLICSVNPMSVAGPSFKERDPQKLAPACPHCRQFFPNHFHMLEHVSVCHVPPAEESYSSSCCNLNSREVTCHKMNRYDRELYVKQCLHEICGRSLKMGEDLKQIKCIHRQETPNSCDVCSAALRLSMNVQNEKASHGCDKQANDIRYLNSLSDHSERPYKCEICDATFKQWAGLKGHQIVHNPEKPHMCNMCGTGFKQSSALEIHKRIHTNEKPYSCDVCNASFKQSSHLKQHKRIHTNETPYSCDVCKAAFKQSIHLKQHKRIHTNEKPYVCDVCNTAFRQSEHLRQHKRIHTNETPYSCDMCSAAFKQSIHLKQHRRIHTNEKPYSCDLCSAAFKQSEHLKLHKRTHTNEKPYSCDVCNAAFKQSAHLKQHKRIHLQYKPSNVSSVVSLT